jgi:hypothetical protein
MEGCGKRGKTFKLSIMNYKWKIAFENMNQDIWKFGLRIVGLAAYGKAGGLARVSGNSHTIDSANFRFD